MSHHHSSRGPGLVGLAIFFALSGCARGNKLTSSGGPDASDSGPPPAEAGVDADAGIIPEGGADADQPLPEDAPDLRQAPVSTAAPGFDAIDHPLSPGPRLAGFTGPLPTNAWWQNIVLGDGAEVVAPMPYQLKVSTSGLQAALPVPRQETYGGERSGDYWLFAPFDRPVAFGATTAFAGEPVVTKFDELSVTVRWSTDTEDAHMTAPLVRGMPYVSARYEGLTPALTFASGISALEPAGDLPASRFEVQLASGIRWIVYASTPVSLQSDGARLVASEAFEGWLRASVLQHPDLELGSSDARAEILDAHAGRIPTAGEVGVFAVDDQGELRFAFASEGQGELLMMALPHHLDVLPEDQRTSFLTPTLKGTMLGIRGTEWRMPEPLTTIAWHAPTPIDPRRTDAIREALQDDQNFSIVATDPYGFGKQVAAVARLALIADQLGETELASHFRDVAAKSLEPWLSGTNGDPLRYDRTWGGIVVQGGVNDSGSNFGQGYYNDHHFHYGYHVYAAAVIAKEDAQWADTWAPRVKDLVRDIANPSDSDPHMTPVRNKDWYAGHSWAGGLFPSAASRNQESSSEAVNAWYGVYLWGLARNDAQLRDLGRVLLGTELRAAHRYWQMTSDNDVYAYAPEFAAQKTVGILWGTKVDYGTWFGANAEWIHGIQMLPFTPISEELMRPAWVEEAYPLLATRLPPNPTDIEEAWKGFLYLFHGVTHPEEAWTQTQTLTGFDAGNSKTNSLYWLATRPTP